MTRYHITPDHPSRWVRLLRCVRVLGPILGVRAWRMRNRAIKNPRIVFLWIYNWEKGANAAEILGKKDEAECFRGMASEARAWLRTLSPSLLN
jgi:hypothetical protein